MIFASDVGNELATASIHGMVRSSATQRNLGDNASTCRSLSSSAQANPWSKIRVGSCLPTTRALISPVLLSWGLKRAGQVPNGISDWRGVEHGGLPVTGVKRVDDAI